MRVDITIESYCTEIELSVECNPGTYLPATHVDPEAYEPTEITEVFLITYDGYRLLHKQETPILRHLSPEELENIAEVVEDRLDEMGVK